MRPEGTLGIPVTRNGGENGRDGDGSKALNAAGIFRPTHFQNSIGAASSSFKFCYLSPRKAETRTNATERKAIASAIIIMISFIVFLLPFDATQNNLPMLNSSPEPTFNSKL
jgi:hypothetical protein